MKVLRITTYLDGGTLQIETNEGVFCIDDRIRTATKGVVYNGYPRDDNSNQVVDQHSIKERLVDALLSDNLYTEHRGNAMALMAKRYPDGSKKEYETR